MTLRLPEHWIWDFWFAQNGDDVHVFYLQAPRSLGDPELRHHNASIGHAVSRDLHTWRVLPDALRPGSPGEFDDLATWTGSVFATAAAGISRTPAPRGRRTAWCSASGSQAPTTSSPGGSTAWCRRPTRGGTRRTARASCTGADPWLVWDEPSEGFHMLITARANHGAADARGVIGHARSPDLRSWEAGPPLSQPGEFASSRCHSSCTSAAPGGCFSRDSERPQRRAARPPGVLRECGTHYLTAPEKFGDYRAGRRSLPRRRPGRPALRRPAAAAPRRVAVRRVADARRARAVRRRAERSHARGPDGEASARAGGRPAHEAT